MGGSNTLVTAGIVAALSFVLPGIVAFTIAFTLGLAYSVLLTGRWVFNARLTRNRTLLYVGAYGAIYLCGLGIVAVAGVIGLPPWTSAASVLVTAPLSFFAGRVIFISLPKKQESH